MSDDKVDGFKVGDCLLRLREEDAGRVFTVSDIDPPHMRTKSPKMPGDLRAPWAMGLISTFADPEEWRRVPPGYTVPRVAEWLSTTERLVEAYRAMLADPETGAAGVDATVRQMATMAGLEVGA